MVLDKGHSRRDMRARLRNTLEQHQPRATEHSEVEEEDDTTRSDDELIAWTREHFGNLPHRSD